MVTLLTGTNLVVNTDITVNEETPMQDIEYNLIYSNVNATTYENTKEFALGEQNEAFRRFGNGISVTKSKIAAPDGLVVANRYKNYSDNGAEIATIKQGNKEAILKTADKERIISKQVLMINNLPVELQNAKLIGRLPVEGVKTVDTNEDLGNNLNLTLASAINKVDNSNSTYNVYYSENVNATQDLNDPQNAWSPNPTPNTKTYMIVFGESIKPGQLNKFNLNLKLPANLDYNKQAVGTEQVIFNAVDSSNTGKLTPEVRKVEQGKEVRYTYEVTNESKTITAKKVENYIDTPKGFEIVKIETPEKEVAFSRDIDRKYNV